MNDRIETVPLCIGNEKAVDNHAEAEEDEGQVIARVNGDFQQALTVDRWREGRIPTEKSASMEKDTIDFQGKGVQSIADVARAKKDVHEEWKDDDMMDENGEYGWSRIVQTIEKIPEEIANTESDQSVVEKVDVRQRIGQHFGCMEHGYNQQHRADAWMDETEQSIVP